jgi:hypothetical protein
MSLLRPLAVLPLAVLPLAVLPLAVLPLAVLAGVMFPVTSRATSGPWTGRDGIHNMYVGGHHAAFTHYVDADGSDADLGGAIRSLGAQAIWSYGVARGMETELTLPFVMVSSPEGSDSCGSCEPTNAIGTIEVQYKYRLLNEGDDGPLTISALGAVRTGALHAATRKRMTNAGDGATDFGAGLALGRYSAGTVTYWMQAEGTYFFRLPLGEGSDGQKIPADEVVSELELGFKPHHMIGLSGGLTGFWRMGGEDIGDWAASVPADLRWASLDANQMMAGGKLMVSPAPHITVVTSAYRTVASKNNPSDNLVLSGGVGVYLNH